jgi:hypothetical protein
MALLNKLVKFGIYAAIFLGALLCSLYLTSKWIIQSEEEVLVPNLVGHDTVYALDLLTSLGLNIKVGGSGCEGGYFSGLQKGAGSQSGGDENA